METVVEAPAVPRRLAEPEPACPQRRITVDQEAAILTRADELNARIARIVGEYR
ncbi:hypothetical protein L3Q67_27015 [Saccharothrix sp. AJ9571]|nr:hypothetical protein L3Q67_27015 [Saccharothrix sp. AJ9571]